MTFTAGYELTFTNASLIAAGAARGELDCDTRDNIAACARYANEVRASIGDHAYSVEDDGYGFPRYVFTYPDGYWIKIEIDPWVVEVTGKHLTVGGYKGIAARMEHLFAIAARVGLAPHERIGGGHIHIGRTSFGAEPMAVRNFIVDYCNHPELALGVLGCDPLNAPPLASAPVSSIAEFVDGLARLDAGDIDLDAFLQHLRTRVYTYGATNLPARAARSKYQALSVDRSDTIEIRAIRPQRCFAELIDVMQFFQSRIAFLAGRAPIPYRDGHESLQVPTPRSRAPRRSIWNSDATHPDATRHWGDNAGIDGKPIAFVLTRGERHGSRMLPALPSRGAVCRPGRPRLRPRRVAGNKAYTGLPVRSYLRRRDIGAVIPT